MAASNRCTVTIDGTDFGAVYASVKVSNETSHSGNPQMCSLNATIRVWADFHDNKNLPFSKIKKMFDLANVVTKDKIKDIKIEHWKDDSPKGTRDALCSYHFKGWISRFETTNPIELTELDPKLQAELQSLPPGLNHVMVLDLEPADSSQLLMRN